MRPTERTLKWFRDRGYLAGIVERWMPLAVKKGSRAGYRLDLWNFADVLAVRSGERVIAVQCFGATGWTAHERKILGTPEIAENVRIWLSGEQRLLFVGWRPVKKKRGGVAVTYQPRVGEVRVNPHTGELELLEEEVDHVD